jgi:glycosyltransferase involved in cell wall biosynthesis
MSIPASESVTAARGRVPTTVVLLGPARQAVSGVSTHLNQLFTSGLVNDFRLLHFQVGSEGRAAESALSRIVRLVWSPLAFAGFCLRERPVIVHLNTSLEPKSYWRDIAFLVIAKSLGKRILYQVHGGALPQDMFRGKPLRTWLLGKVLRAADLVVLLAQVEHEAYSRFAPGISLEVIANAIDPDTLVRHRLEAEFSDSLHAVYVGRIAQNKGVFEVVEALGQLRDEGRTMQLTIAGSGPDERRLRTLVERLQLGDRVRFAGPLYGEDKNALWRSAHVFAFPTYHREGLPYSLLEAMAVGAVAVTTRVGAIPDVLRDGIEGLVVEPKSPAAVAEALRCLDDDRALVARMAQAGRARVLLKYSVSRLTDDFRRVYLRLAANGS